MNNIIKKGKYLIYNVPPQLLRLDQDFDLFRSRAYERIANIENKNNDFRDIAHQNQSQILLIIEHILIGNLSFYDVLPDF